MRRYPFFAFLDEAQLRAVAMLSEEIEVEDGTLVFDTGQPAAALCLLTEGSLELYYAVVDREDPELRKEFFLSEFSPGDIFGISALIEPYVYTSSVRASASSRVVRMDGTGLRALCEVDPRMAAGLMRATAKTAME
ncbi:MAG TPA: cyclic nucleotide-binding domain-containing protein, partial [Anaerolineae bacterium]|nr:cyclic nucleotide-binding domain-containing protein [Anaerolineae bacterium]